MGLYASQPRRLVGQLVADASVLLWTVGWAFAGLAVHGAVALLAAPARLTSRTATRLAGDFRDAATEAERLPAVGADLAASFDAAARTLGSLVAAAEDQVTSIERLAILGGVLTFLMPVAIVVALWLPRRVRFYRESTASQRFLDSQADLDLFALRAMASQPLHVLAGISDDPARAWRERDQRVIAQLADVELRRSGMKVPDRLRPAPPVGEVGGSTEAKPSR